LPPEPPSARPYAGGIVGLAKLVLQRLEKASRIERALQIQPIGGLTVHLTKAQTVLNNDLTRQKEIWGFIAPAG
jgi:hypothetical protein